MSCLGSSSGNLSAHTIDSAVKNLPANAGDMEVWVRSLGREDPLKKEMSTHSSILAWEISWTEEPRALLSMGSRRVGYDLATKHASTYVMIVIANFKFFSRKDIFSFENEIES